MGRRPTILIIGRGGTRSPLTLQPAFATEATDNHHIKAQLPTQFTLTTRNNTTTTGIATIFQTHGDLPYATFRVTTGSCCDPSESQHANTVLTVTTQP